MVRAVLILWGIVAGRLSSPDPSAFDKTSAGKFDGFGRRFSSRDERESVGEGVGGVFIWVSCLRAAPI